MDFIYNFYHSETVKNIAASYGYALLPNFLRDLVVEQIMSDVMCNDGVTYAFEKYFKTSLNIYTASTFESTLQTYLSAYENVDNSPTWNTSSASDSTLVWSTYDSAPDTAAAYFGMLASKALKVKYYTDTNVIVQPFAHVAIVPIYKLFSFAAATDTKLRLTFDILAGIFQGTITYWDDQSIKNANGDNAAYLPHKRITVVIRGSGSDATAIYLRYLAKYNASFKATYNVDTDYPPESLSLNISAHHMKTAYSNDDVDMVVGATDGSIGFFELVRSPTSNISTICYSDYCSSASTILDTQALIYDAVANCSADPATFIDLASQDLNVKSQDLMLSNSPGCYPIAGTIDLAIYQSQSSTCTGTAGLVDSDAAAYARTKFGIWMYNGSAIAGPLKNNHLVPTSTVILFLLQPLPDLLRCEIPGLRVLQLP
jgi:hypothetical protein